MEKTKEQITIQELAGYIGCKVLIIPLPVVNSHNTEDIITLQVHNLVLQKKYKIYPYLTPISKLTEEHARGLCEVMGFVFVSVHLSEGFCVDIITTSCGIDIYNDGNIACANKIQEIEPKCFPVAKLINYLRSKGYDMDNLIGRGLAIEK